VTKLRFVLQSVG